ncbi:hypothetical protein [Bacillus spizizenii]|uniref:hypothetical protein n=1 Tax=Bacillus spizizenii TaxID=96241 RepID=UPI00036180CC|nr:hypothetical protein [Bacillus spizizenii]
MKNKKICSLPLLCAVLIVAFSFCLNSNAAAAQNVPKEKAIMKQQETMRSYFNH